jgi:hypothetical protein
MCSRRHAQPVLAGHRSERNEFSDAIAFLLVLLAAAAILAMAGLATVAVVHAIAWLVGR